MNQPWERQPGESPRAYQAFRCYLNLGPGRTIVDAYRSREPAKGRQRSASRASQKFSRTSGRWSAWATQHEWSERALAFDRNETELQDVERKRVAGEVEEAWAARRSQLREREFAAGEELLAAAKAIRKRAPATYLRMIMCAFDLQRRACDMDKVEAEVERTARLELVLKEIVVDEQGAVVKVVRFPNLISDPAEWSEHAKKEQLRLISTET